MEFDGAAAELGTTENCCWCCCCLMLFMPNMLASCKGGPDLKPAGGSCIAPPNCGGAVIKEIINRQKSKGKLHQGLFEFPHRSGLKLMSDRCGALQLRHLPLQSQGSFTCELHLGCQALPFTYLVRVHRSLRTPLLYHIFIILGDDKCTQGQWKRHPSAVLDLDPDFEARREPPILFHRDGPLCVQEFS